MGQINQQIVMDYCERLGINPNPKKINAPHFKALYVNAVRLANANILPFEAVVVAATTNEIDAILSGDVEGKPALRQVEGWNACRMMATGNFRLATPEENDRYFQELRDGAEKCKEIEENRPEKAQIRVSREEAAHTRDMLRTLVGAAAGSAVAAEETGSATAKPNNRKGGNG